MVTSDFTALKPSRLALRAYDACQAGDDADAKELFDRLERLAK